MYVVKFDIMFEGTYQIRKTVSDYISKKLVGISRAGDQWGGLSKQREESYEFKVFEKCGQTLSEVSS